MQLPCLIAIENPESSSTESGLEPCQIPDGAFFMNSRTRMVDVKDGLSSTILIGEVSWKWDHTDGAPRLPDGMSRGGSHWARVADPQLQEHVLTATTDGINHAEVGDFSPCLNSAHAGGAHVAFGDGSVRFLSEKMESSSVAPFGVLQHLSTIQGHEAVPGF